MKATMRFSYQGVNYDKGDTVDIADKGQAAYLKNRKLVSGETGKLDDEPTPLSQEEITKIQTTEKRSLTEKAPEKKEIKKP